MPASFRDPDGQVIASRGRVQRCVRPHAATNMQAFLQSDAAAGWFDQGILPRTRQADPGRIPDEWAEEARLGGLILEHEPVWFPSYPYEWPPEMLYAAGELTIRLARGAHKAGFRLKDASPYNILFEGPRAVFIDLLSFDRGNEREALWHAYAQFVQNFVYPLLAVRHCRLRLDELLLVHRDGLPPARLAPMIRWWRRLVPPLLGAVTIPALLRGPAAAALAVAAQARDGEEAGYLMSRMFARAESLLAAARPRLPEAGSLEYGEHGHPYTEAERAHKDEAVARMLAASRPASVLDIGCNTGRYSMAAAAQGARVAALDADPDVAGALWRVASAQGLPILPLVIDIARPPGGCGWLNTELPSFLDRARGRFDCVMMLALIHHLLVTERIPLDSIADLAAELTCRDALVEYVDPADTQFSAIARGRQSLHAGLTVAAFEASFLRRFSIVSTEPLRPTRSLYLLHKSER